MIAGSLEIQMLANMAELRKQMDQAVGVVQGASAQMQKAADLAGKALGLIGVGLSLGAFTGFIRNAINAADALDEMSGRIGVSAKELSGLQLAYRQAGMGNDAMASSIAKLSQEMSQGNVGLRALGVNAKDAAGNLKTPTAVLLELSDKFANLQDGAGKTALAMEIFGKSGAEMVPLLNSGSQGIREMIEMSERLGLVIEDETAAKAGQFNDTLELLGLGVQGVGTRIAAQLLPTLNNLTGSFLESMTQGDRLRGVADFLATSMKGLYTVGVGVVEMFNTLGKAAGGGIAAIMAVLRGDFSGAKRILDEAKTDILGGWASAAKVISKTWSDEGDAAVAATAKIIKSSGDLLAAQKAREKAVKETKDPFESLLESVVKTTTAYKAEHAAGEKLTEGQKKAVEVLEQLRSGKVKVTQVQAILLGQGLEAMLQAEAENQEREEFLKIAKAEADARKKIADAAEQSVQSLLEQNRGLRDEIELIGLSSEQQEVFLRNRRQTVILTKEATLAELERQAAITGTMTREHIALVQEIEQLKERNELLGQKDLRERETRGWADFYGSIESTAHGVWTDVANNGMSAFERVGKTIKASVLDVLWQIVGRRWLINIGTSIFGAGFGTAASAATAGSNPLGLMLQGTQLYSGLTSGTGMLGTVGNWLGLGSAASAATTGMTAGMSLANPGMAAMINPVTSGAAASGGLSGMLGAIPGWGWALAGVAALAGIFSKKSTPHLGAASSYSADAGLQSNTDIYAALGFTDTRHYDAQVESITAPLASAIGKALDGIAVTFGQKAGYEVAAAFADDSSKDGAWGNLRIRRAGETVAEWGNTDGDKWAGITLSHGEAGIKEFMARAAGTVKTIIADMGLPEWASRIAANMPDTGSMDDLTNALASISAYPAQLLQQFGADRDQLVQLYVQGLASGDAVAAGQSVADALVSSVRNAVFANAAGQIFDTVNVGIVTPMLDAIATGASVSEALSSASIEATIERAKTQAAALAELFGNAEFQQALNGMRDAVASALGQAGRSLQSLPYTVQVIDTAAQAAEVAANEAAKAWQSITDGLLDARFQAEMDLLRAQGREAEAVARERARAIEGYDAEQIALFDGTQAILAQVKALEDQAKAAEDASEKAKQLAATLASELPGVIDQYLTGDALTAARYGRIADSLGAAGITVSAADLAAATKQQIGEAAVAIYNMVGTSDEARLAILRAAGALATLKDEAAAAAKAEQEAAKAKAVAELEKAWKAFERSVQARRTALQDTINDVKGVFDMVRDAARDLYGDVAQTAAMQYRDGLAFISDSLRNAIATGALPDAEKLRDAISAARAGLDSQEYATQAEGDYQRMVVASQLSLLGDISGDQLTEAQQQLQALEDLYEAEQLAYEALRAQIDATFEGTAATLEVRDAVDRLHEVMARIQAGGGGGRPAAGVMRGAGGSTYDPATGVFASGSGQWDLQALAPDIVAMVGAGRGREVYDIARQYGVTSDMLADATGSSAEVIRKWAADSGLPAFARGGVHSGGWALVGEEGPEFAYLPPARIYTASETARMQASGGDTGALEERLDALLTSQKSATEAMLTTRDVLVKVTRNGNAMATETV